MQSAACLWMASSKAHAVTEGAHVAAGCECGNEPRCSWRPFLLPGSVLSHTAAPVRSMQMVPE